MSDVTEETRCPQCGARNKADADWCTQCYTRLDEPTPSPPPPPSAPTPAVGPVPPAPAEVPPGTATDATGDGTLRSGDGRFRQAEDGLEWRCEVCQEWNPIERVTCRVCSTPFGRSPRDDQRPARPDVAPALLVGGSLVLPGLGHWLLGLRGAAVLRLVLALVWGLGGITLFLQARESGQSFLPAVPLLLGWAIVAAGSANDAHVEGGGAGQLALSGRTLLWVTTGVVGGTFAAVLVGVLSAVGG